MQWITIRELEGEARTPTEWHEKLVRNRNPSQFVAKARTDDTIAFLSGYWLGTEKDKEVTVAIAQKEKRRGSRSQRFSGKMWFILKFSQENSGEGREVQERRLIQCVWSGNFRGCYRGACKILTRAVSGASSEGDFPFRCRSYVFSQRQRVSWKCKFW